MNRQELAEKIKNGVELTENERKALAKLLTQKQYGLIWEDKPEAVEEMLHSHLPVLYEVPENAHTDATKHISNADTLFPTALPNAPNHILIEGDNLHALTSLAFTHSGKIDVIYIDPPYNTGNRDFKYNDRYIDRDDAYRHSTWLSFMQKRLRIARDLLKETGVVFISIDDNEQAQLKLLCDEIFGEENFVANIIWQKKYSPQNDAKYFSDNHDFILVYKRATWKINLLERTDSQLDRYKNPDNDERGVWKSTDFSVKTYSENYDYPIALPSGRIVNPPAGRCWTTSKERLQDLINDNRIWFGEKGNNVPALKKFLSEVKEGTTPITIWTYEEVGHNQSAKQELKAIFADTQIQFETPKPVSLINRILKLSTTSTATVLDFFAGSGTTGHAVMALNAEDGGSRQFILCTNNEVNGIAKKLQEEGKSEAEIEAYGICRSVTLPRLQRVIKGYTKPNGTAVEGLKNNRLRYYRTDYVSREPSLANKMELTRRATDLLSMRHNCYTAIETQNADIQFFKGDDNLYLMVVYSEDAIAKAVEIISDLPKGVLVKTYVFSTGSDPYEDEFDDVADKVNLLPIPQVIYNTYQHLMNRMK